MKKIYNTFLGDKKPPAKKINCRYFDEVLKHVLITMI